MLVGYEMTIANSYVSRGHVSSEYSYINDSYKYIPFTCGLEETPC